MTDYQRIEAALNELNDINSNQEGFINTFFLDLTTNIQTHRNSILKKINSYFDEVLNSVSDLKSKLLNRCNQLDFKVEGYKQNLASLNESLIDSDLRIDLCKRTLYEIEQKQSYLKEFLFDFKYIQFTKNDNFELEELCGRLSCQSIVIYLFLSFLFAIFSFYSLLKYAEEELELKSWANKKYEDNWRPFQVESYEEIILNIKEADPEWLNQFCDYLRNEGLSERTVSIIRRNSKAEFWPIALNTTEKIAAAENSIKQLYLFRKFLTDFEFKIMFTQCILFCILRFENQYDFRIQRVE
jgi:hypothetical protein